MNVRTYYWKLALLLMISAGVASQAQESAPAPTGAALAANAQTIRAAWQTKLTLGPGDTLNLALLDLPETAQKAVPIGPDGRITFLQARDIQAQGLSIDELRGKLDDAL